MAVLVSTPYMDEAARCHRVALLHEGAIIAEGSPSELASGLEHEVYEVAGGDRDELYSLLADHRAVIAASPAGARLRVVVIAGQGAQLAAEVAPRGASLRRVLPDFEDLFLARIAQHEATS
jgi:ABC-2 type transport system ATP-binding protein